MPVRRTFAIAVAAACVLVVSGCTITFLPPTDTGVGTVERPRPPADDTSTDDRPERPEPSAELPGDEGFRIFEVAPLNIYPGTQMYFRVAVRRSGYLTISALAPDGRVRVLVRDQRIEASGGPVRVPPLGSPEPVEGRAPEGTWRLRASWSPRPIMARYDGLRGLDAWTAAIRDDLRGADGASVLEAYYEVLRR